MLQGETDAEVVAPVGRGVGAAKSTATERSIAVPATATIHTASASGRTYRICLSSAAVLTIPVTAPLPNITTHIIDAQFVGSLSLHSVSHAASVLRVPRHITESIAATIMISFALIAATGCKLPFCLGRHAEVLASQTVELCDERLYILIADEKSRIVVTKPFLL